MGNRCIIKGDNSNIGVYLHWNGGRNSVEAFLKYCKEKDCRGFNNEGYGIARFCQVVGNWFGGTLSIGVQVINDKDLEEIASHLDNGIYIINDNWEEIKHIGKACVENYDEKDLIESIDKAQPVTEQMKEYLFAEEVDAEDLKIGDKVYCKDFENNISIHTVIGIKYDWNPDDVQPFIDRYSTIENVNPNDILRGKVKIVK